jgi:hypothetical protein
MNLKNKVNNMIYGALIYDSDQDRMDIRFDDDHYHGGLHCGTPLEVFTGGKWVPTRIEKSDDWYLVGLKILPLTGLRTRIAS